MGLRQAAQVLRSAWWLPAAGLVLGGAAGVVVSLLTPQVYTADAQLLVTTYSDSNADAVQAAQFTSQQMGSYAELVTGAEMAARITDAIGDDRSPDEVAAEITASVVAGTFVLDVTVSDPSAETARDIAEALATEFGPFLRDLNPDGPAVNASVVDRPEVPGAPTEPKPLRNIGLGSALGLFAGIGLVAVRFNLSGGVWDPTAVAGLTRTPVVGVVFKDRRPGKGQSSARTPSGQVVDTYRRLATTVRLMGDGPPQVVMICSVGEDEGAAESAVHLSSELVDAGHRVTLVDADVKGPRVGQRLGTESAAGLTDVLSGTASLDDAVVSDEKTGLQVLSPGSVRGDAEKLLVSDAVGPLLEKLRGRSDYVVITVSGAATSAAPLAIAPFADVVLINVRYGRTQKDQLREGAEAIVRVRARLAGVIMTDVPVGTPISGMTSDEPLTV